MLDEQHFNRVTHALPVLQAADPQLVREFKQAAFFARIPAGCDVFAEGDQIDAIALLISGFDVCVFAPLVGCPLSGPKIRAAK